MGTYIRSWIFRVILTSLIILSAITILGGWGTAQTTKTRFYSQSLHKNMKVDVYLPPGYDNNTRGYPVLYVIHGKDANEDSWMNGFFGINGLHIDKISNDLLKAGKIKPMIIVSPEIDNSYGINSSKTTFSQNGYNHGMYEDYLLKELIPYIDSHYRTIRSPHGRYIAGFSMGGFVALHLAFEHPDLFSKVGGLSAALWQGEYPSGLEELSWVYPNPTVRNTRDPLILAKTRDLNSMQISLDNGDSDMDWIETSNQYLYNELKKQADIARFHVGHGGHDYGYWSTRIHDLLTFFDGIS